MDKLISLSSLQIENLRSQFEEITFKNDCHFVYEKQIPPAAIVLIEGRIELIKKKKTSSVIQKQYLFAINNLSKGVPLKFGVLIKANSRVILIGKSDLHKIREYQDSHRP